MFDKEFAMSGRGVIRVLNWNLLRGTEQNVEIRQ